MYYYLIIAVKLYCFYHAYKNQKSYYWFFVIFFIPIIGSIIYIITQVFNKKDAEKIQIELTHVINPTKKTKKLEKRLQFSDTYANRIELADAYFMNKNVANAILNYKKTFEDKIQDNLYARQQLILCCFELQNYESVVEHSEFIKDKSEFKGSKQQFCYGLALNELGSTKEAEAQLQQINRPYSNYAERLELAKFYIKNDKEAEAKLLLEEISLESQHMTKTNRHLYRATIIEAERLLKTV